MISIFFITEIKIIKTSFIIELLVYQIFDIKRMLRFFKNNFKKNNYIHKYFGITLTPNNLDIFS
jgi:hypothetical protein